MDHRFSKLWKQYTVLVLIAVVGIERLLACDNEYHFGEDLPRGSKSIAWNLLGPVEYVKALNDRTPPTEDEFNKKREAAEKGDFRDQTNFGVAIMRRGLHAQARDIFAKLAVEHESEYVIAANLGTAYELTGDVPNALKWIRRGIELNPDSHEKTEWLHVKLLEAKLTALSNPKWFAQNTILNLDFGKDAFPDQPKVDAHNVRHGHQQATESIRHALEYQLHERLFYVKSPDPVVFDLLFTLGNILMVSENVDKAAEVYRLAKSYQIHPNAVFETRRVKADEIIASKLAALEEQEYPVNHPILNSLRPYYWQIAVGLVLLFGSFGYLFFKRKASSSLADGGRG